MLKAEFIIVHNGKKALKPREPNGPAPKQLHAHLQANNGRRTERTLSTGDIMSAAMGLLPSEHVFLHGGIAQRESGKPPSSIFHQRATVAAVWREQDGKAYALVRVAGATRSVTGFGRYDRWNADAYSGLGILIHDALQEAKALTGLCDDPNDLDMQVDAPGILADALEDAGHPLARVLRAMDTHTREVTDSI